MVGSEDKGVLGGNEVVSDDDDVEPALPSAEVDMFDEDFKEPLVKRQRKLQTHSTSEVVSQRTGLRTRKPVTTRMRTTSTNGCKGEEGENKTKTKTFGQCFLPLGQSPVFSAEDIWPLDKTSLDVCAELEKSAVEPTSDEGSPEQVVTEVEKTVTEQPTMSLGKVEFDYGEGPSANEPKLVEFSFF
ncbi:hypothetical protein AXG93_3643s1000 [Marchantia polymorpha subsp. ruderalis]|uniref:Uncharacterized protein n=1 Tax=Marchantia polymorpha subsp. ruderalis TaxID=1480154 RepID=A0A176VEA2_MARPO|nr:hypothetical protein AXG93_3643s1000 [Marchantia polymorpha subsp. ruderalis]